MRRDTERLELLHLLKCAKNWLLRRHRRENAAAGEEADMNRRGNDNPIVVNSEDDVDPLNHPAILRIQELIEINKTDVGRLENLRFWPEQETEQENLENQNANLSALVTLVNRPDFRNLVEAGIRDGGDNGQQNAYGDENSEYQDMNSEYQSVISNSNELSRRSNSNQPQENPLPGAVLQQPDAAHAAARDPIPNADNLQNQNDIEPGPPPIQFNFNDNLNAMEVQLNLRPPDDDDSESESSSASSSGSDSEGVVRNVDFTFSREKYVRAFEIE